MDKKIEVLGKEGTIYCGEKALRDFFSANKKKFKFIACMECGNLKVFIFCESNKHFDIFTKIKNVNLDFVGAGEVTLGNAFFNSSSFVIELGRESPEDKELGNEVLTFIKEEVQKMK